MSEPGASTSLPRASKRQRTLRYSDPRQSRSSTASSSSTNTVSTPTTSCSPDPTSRSQPARLKRFLSWCRSEGIHIDPSLDLRYSGDAISWSIAIHASTSIDNDTVVATIPKTAVLSRKTSALAPVLKGKYLSDSHETVGLELALCLLYERCLGPGSRFEPFLSILPRLPVPLPLLRDTASDRTHCRWLTGTETDRIDSRASHSHHLSTHDTWPYDHDYGMSKQKALDYFYSTGIPILARSKLFDRTQREHLDGLEGAFLTAYTHVSSRDFIVDTYHGVGMVPVADLFNHAEVHTVQFESDQDVCELCGVALLTGHEEEECRFGLQPGSGGDDEEDEEEEDGELEEVGGEPKDDAEGETIEKDPKSSEEPAEEEDEVDDDDETLEHEDTLDMRTLTSFPPGEEMYNTYGALSNALLLTRYGFCLDTDTDFERFTIDLRFPAERQAFFQSFLSSPSFGCIADVSSVFDEVLKLVADRFPKVIDEDDAIDPVLHVESGAIDSLFQLDTLLPTQPDWLTLCPLFQPSTAPDRDLVDRDHIHPLFLTATGRISTPLFVLTLLLHQPSSLGLQPALLKFDNTTVQSSLRTLHAFCSARLGGLYITSHLPRALDLLETPTPYVEKACIHHAYQEHFAISTAVASLTDLITPSA